MWKHLVEIIQELEKSSSRFLNFLAYQEQRKIGCTAWHVRRCADYWRPSCRDKNRINHSSRTANICIVFQWIPSCHIHHIVYLDQNSTMKHSIETAKSVPQSSLTFVATDSSHGSIFRCVRRRCFLEKLSKSQKVSAVRHCTEELIKTILSKHESCWKSNKIIKTNRILNKNSVVDRFSAFRF